MIEITPTNQLPKLYKEWAREDPIFYKAAEFLETGQIRESSLNWNVKLRDRIRQLIRYGDSIEDVHEKVKKHMSVETIKNVLHRDCMANSTARVAYYTLQDK